MENYHYGNTAGPGGHVASLEAVRKKINAKDWNGAKHGMRALRGTEQNMGAYQTLGNFYLDIGGSKLAGGSKGGISGYRRELDLAEGMGRVSYAKDGINFTREYFVSYPDNVFVIHLKADRPGSVSFKTRFEFAHEVTTSIEEGVVTSSGTLSNILHHGSRFKVVSN